MSAALIGYTGFVGTTLRKQKLFEWQYRSTNINEIAGKSFELVVCAGAPAQKWIANREPEADRLKIEFLIQQLQTVTCKTFILISTVDVFQNPLGVNEETAINDSTLHAYGCHRYLLEKFVKSHFPNHLIVRLPGLVGPGLRKNVIFDYLHNNNLHAIDSRGVFQFYPMINLWYDLHTALSAGLKLVHLTAEPISVREVITEGFGKTFDHTLAGIPATYDMQSLYAELFGGKNGYQYSKRETIQATRAYAQTEAVANTSSQEVIA